MSTPITVQQLLDSATKHCDAAQVSDHDDDLEYHREIAQSYQRLAQTLHFHPAASQEKLRTIVDLLETASIQGRRTGRPLVRLALTRYLILDTEASEQERRGNSDVQ